MPPRRARTRGVADSEHHALSDPERERSLQTAQVPKSQDELQEPSRRVSGNGTENSSLTVLRNRAGTGHGPTATRTSLGTRHAHLAVNAALTWCQLILDTLADPEAPWRKNPG
ncbi:abortive infection family protein [Pseudofrankia sp. BMG5.37]|uniref:abortive infection family protein n=1 Tax=Pseudofrankia sp. BMG5.37 TaxID=3050035 RepID=UPI0037C93335